MERSDAAQPISITLDVTNYVLWAQAMSSFIKGKKLWRIITGDVVKPIKGDTETQLKYDERLDDWDSKNHLIITWCRNTSVTSINLQFGRFQNVDGPAKAIWDFLKERYSTTGLAHQYQLLSLLHRMHQEPGQSIDNFLSQTRIGSSAPNPNLCRYCHSPDHQLLYCPIRICKHCLKPGKGHYQEDCYKNPNRHAADTYSPVSKSDIKAIVKQVLLNSGTPPSTALSMTSGSSSWFFDSACCNHMTFDSTLFSSKSSTANTRVVHRANGSHMHVSHVGSVVTTNATLSDTYLILTLTLNLISVGQLCDLGLTITFSRTGCHVQDPQTGKILGIGRKTGRLFKLINLHLPPHLTSTVQPVASVSSNPSIGLWHSRLGHMSISRLRSLVSSGKLGSVKIEEVATSVVRRSSVPSPPQLSPNVTAEPGRKATSVVRRSSVPSPPQLSPNVTVEPALSEDGLGNDASLEQSGPAEECLRLRIHQRGGILMRLLNLLSYKSVLDKVNISDDYHNNPLAKKVLYRKCYRIHIIGGTK
ncbi:hypothetical protein Vadar_001385 [Vaccinium darrowii]|uniref:Uncharacterized protein n=1 Tax=Vaccinium darrowii TaxID=229202 RepID=A0ACB7XWT2_9ERIC|nr:hypothetical protein Vadar_001385 [Vaccinium darrowii]